MRLRVEWISKLKKKQQKINQILCKKFIGFLMLCSDWVDNKNCIQKPVHGDAKI